MGSIDSKVMGFLSSKKKFKVKELADYLGVDWYKARNILLKLKRREIVKESESERGIWIYIADERQKYLKYKEKILHYMEGQTVPQSVSHISLVFKIGNKYTSKLLKELVEEGFLKRVKRGYYIHANMQVVQVGSGNKPLYKTPLQIHHITLEHALNCKSEKIDQKLRKVTVSPYGIVNQSQKRIDDYGWVRIDIGSRATAIMKVDKIWNNKRTGWWEIDTHADIGSKIIPIHLQIGECKIILKTRNGEKAMDIREYERWKGWLMATFHLLPKEWLLKEIDINEDWVNLYERYGGLVERRFDIADNLLYHEYVKKIEGTQVVRKEIQYHDKRGVANLEDIGNLLFGGVELREAVERMSESFKEGIKEMKEGIENRDKEMIEGMVGLADGLKSLGEMVKLLSEKQDEMIKNQNTMAKALKYVVDDMEERKKKELERIESMEKENINKDDTENYIH